jgi:hypothetical protein
MDVLITILKYIALFISSISGILGLLSDFRDKQTNKITKNGYRLLWLIVASGFVSLALQSLELYRDKKKDEIAEQKSLEEAKRTNQMLSDLNRTLNPIKDINVSYTIQIPLYDPKLKNYKARLITSLDSIFGTLSNVGIEERREILDKDYGIFVTGYSANSILSIELRKDSPLLPDKMNETLAYYVLQYGEVDYKFYDSTVRNISDTTIPDFHFTVATGIVNNGLNGEHKIEYNFENKALYIEAFMVNSDPRYWDKTGKIISIPDLSKAKSIITLPSIVVSGNNQVDNQLEEIRKGFQLKRSFFRLTEGRELHFKQKNLTRISKANELPKYLFLFPRNLAEISSY